MRKRGWALAVGVAAVLTAGLASAAVVQEGSLRLTVLSQVKPFKLPRHGTAPIAVFVSAHVGTRDGTTPPQLQRMTIDVNRHGLLDDTGLPACGLKRIKTASSARALKLCPTSVVGSGRFWASVVLPDQRPYPTRGRLLIFYGQQGGKPSLFAHIFTEVPFATSFVVDFAIRRVDKGPYGTELTTSLPKALGKWGFVDRIKLTLRRKFDYRGRQHSFFNAGCPAVAGADTAVFPLARASLAFADQAPIVLTVEKACRVAR
jgi:hypothetical protein